MTTNNRILADLRAKAKQLAADDVANREIKPYEQAGAEESYYQHLLGMAGNERLFGKREGGE